jgi:hypothetical protein
MKLNEIKLNENSGWKMKITGHSKRKIITHNNSHVMMDNFNDEYFNLHINMKKGMKMEKL